MRAILLVLLCLLVGCARHYDPSVAADYDGVATMSTAKESRSSGFAGGAPPPPPAAPSATRSAPATPAPQGQPATEAAPAPAAARMVHYQGYAELRVGKQQEAVDAILALATEAGGGLEQQYGGTLVIRVP